MAASFGDPAWSDTELTQLTPALVKTAAQCIKPSYKTLRDFVADYDNGKGQLDASLAQLGKRIKANFMDTPVAYLNGQTRSQRYDELEAKINAADEEIGHAMNHDNLDARTNDILPGIERRNNAQARAIRSQILLDGPISHRASANLAATQASNPDLNRSQAQQNVIDWDNQRAAQLTDYRNKLVQQAEDIRRSQLSVQRQISEMRGDAINNYNEAVRHKAVSLVNTTPALQDSVISFVCSEQARQSKASSPQPIESNPQSVAASRQAREF
jgi:hypothetical protein